MFKLFKDKYKKGDIIKTKVKEPWHSYNLYVVEQVGNKKYLLKSLQTNNVDEFNKSYIHSDFELQSVTHTKVNKLMGDKDNV